MIFVMHVCLTPKAQPKGRVRQSNPIASVSSGKSDEERLNSRGRSGFMFLFMFSILYHIHPMLNHSLIHVKEMIR